MTARAALAAAIAAYAAGFSALSVLRHRSFETGRFDLGNMTQAVWSTAHGRPLETTGLDGEQFLRLGAHVDPILVAAAPLWWIWPSPSMLLVVQAVAVALGAWPVFRLALKHLGSERAALGFSLAYLLYPAVQWLTLNEFHAVALATPLLLYAFWCLDEDRLVAFALVAVVAATTKEEIPLVLAAMGVWYAVTRRRPVGAAVAAAGVAWTALAVTVVMPHFKDGGGGAFYGRYSEVGGSPGGILRTAVTDPLRLAEVAFDRDGASYLLELGLPLGALFLAAPLVALVAAPELAINLLSATPTQTSIHFHYTAGLIPPLIVGTVLGAARLTRGRPAWVVPVAGIAAAAALLGNYRLGPMPFWRELPGGSSFSAHAHELSSHDRVAARALGLIPRDAVVSATNTLGGHLSARRRVLSFPFLEDASWVAVDETRPGYADRIAPLPTAVRTAWLRRNPRWELVFQEDGVLVFRRAPEARRARSGRSAAADTR